MRYYSEINKTHGTLFNFLLLLDHRVSDSGHHGGEGETGEAEAEGHKG